MSKILYLVPDLADAAVARRVAMLQAGGATVTVMGFRRTPALVPAIDGCETINLRQTHNARFLQRISAVLAEVWDLPKHRQAFAAADVVLARNLEMLAVGVRGRSLSTTKPDLVYESLDIHRLLLKQGPVGAALRWLEGSLSRRAKALLTSSPAFISEYFEPLSQVDLPTRLIENKVYAPTLPHSISLERTPGPWRIGWFGSIRCPESLHILQNLVQQSNGAIEVIIRGRPASDLFENFEAQVAATPGMRFLGPYANPQDLPAIYNEVDFSWSIDRFEQGQNSAWLLPNRLYEGGMSGVVPLAEKAVETGRFLDRLGIGVTLANPLEKSLADFFATLTPVEYQKLAQKSAAVPEKTWRFDQLDCTSLVRYLTVLAP